MIGGRPVQNFRGARALVIHRADRNREVLEATLNKLGLTVEMLDPPDGTSVRLSAHQTEGADLIIFDADLGPGFVFPWSRGAAPIPLIAVIGVEAPSRLSWLVELSATAYLIKPIRPTGVYSALFIGINEHGRRKQTDELVRSLEARRAARRFVTKAMLHVMRARNVDDDEAFRMLRKESMRLRLSVEDYSRALVEREEKSRDAAASRVCGSRTRD